MNRRTAIVIVSAALAGTVTLTACDPGASGDSGTRKTRTIYYKNGPAGQVIEREIEGIYYEIEVKDGKGKKHEFDVQASVYNDCGLYSYYPSCVKHKSTAKPKAKAPKGSMNKAPSKPKPKKTTKKSSTRKGRR